jgi:hypothetical protein
MRDPLGLLGPEKIWYMNGYYGKKVLEFEDMDHFKAGEVAKTYTLPYYFDGTGSVVYGRYLYFNRSVRISLALEQELFIEIFHSIRMHACRKLALRWNLSFD